MALVSYLRHPTRALRKLQWQAMRTCPRPIELTVDTWNGRLTFNSGDRLISKFLFVRRAYERHYVTKVIEYLDRAGLRSPRRDVVLDVGANIGMIAIALVKHGWYRGAIAIEPETYNFRLLERNVRQNGYREVIACRRAALSSSGGELELVLNEGNLGGHFVRQAEGPAALLGAPPSMRVKTTTCDDILAGELSHLADRIGLVWMDIEGHEGFFFEGAHSTLERRVPVVSEFYPRAIERSGMSRREYLSQVRQRFTHVCTLERGGFVERPIADVDELFDRHADGATNVIYLRRKG